MPCENRIEGLNLQAKELQRFSTNHQKLRRSKKGFTISFRENSPPSPWFWTCSFQNYDTTLLRQPEETNSVVKLRHLSTKGCFSIPFLAETPSPYIVLLLERSPKTISNFSSAFLTFPIPHSQSSSASKLPGRITWQTKAGYLRQTWNYLERTFNSPEVLEDHFL